MEIIIYDTTGEGSPLSNDDFIDSLIDKELIEDSNYDKENEKIIINGVEIELNGTSIGGLSITDAINSGLQVGDFINYDAGTWSQEEIDNLNKQAKGMSISGTADVPTEYYQFGGFLATASRNGNATEYNSEYDYVQIDTNGDDSGDKEISGWRVFDITEGVITLISAGNPEDYYHPYDSTTNYEAYISEYILSGTKNSNVDESVYTKRDWTMYENNYATENTARVLTKTELDSWYETYTLTDGADVYIDDIFQLIYDTETDGYNKYQTLIDNYSYYWLGSSNGNYSLSYFSTSVRLLSNRGDTGYGIRILISLESDIFLTEEEAITVVNSRSATYRPKTWEHTVWSIAN